MPTTDTPADPQPVDTQPDTNSRMRRRVELAPPVLPARTILVVCVGCGGHGKVTMLVHDVLTESIALLADAADGVVVKFYDRLFTINPVLASIFPPDLLTAPAHAEGSRGAGQRDLLVAALVKIATLYGAGEREEAELDGFLRQAGRHHAMLPFPDGHRPPTPREFAEVKQALFETLVAVAGDSWRVEYSVAWGEAYDYAETEMRHAIQHEGRAMTHPRQVRHSADPVEPAH